MKIPTTLKHKPVIVAPNYEQVDGRQAYQSDAKGLSLGLAQWNDRGRVDISAKVWRYTGEKWSRQSEELPLHRVLDLAILACGHGCIFAKRLTNTLSCTTLPRRRLTALACRADAMTVEVCEENEHIDEDIGLFFEGLSKDDELLGERFAILSRILKEMGY